MLGLTRKEKELEYFKLEYDKRYSLPMQLKLDVKLFDKGEPFVWFTTIQKEKELPDFFEIKRLTRSYFCFSDRFKNLLDLYIDQYECAVPFFPTDAKLGRQEVFWQLALEKQDLASKRNIWGKEEVSLRKQLDTDKYCVQIAEYDGQFYNELFIVTLPIAEHVLRKYWNGIKFKPVVVKE